MISEAQYAEVGRMTLEAGMAEWALAAVAAALDPGLAGVEQDPAGALTCLQKLPRRKLVCKVKDGLAGQGLSETLRYDAKAWLDGLQEALMSRDKIVHSYRTFVMDDQKGAVEQCQLHARSLEAPLIGVASLQTLCHRLEGAAAGGLQLRLRIRAELHS